MATGAVTQIYTRIAQVIGFAGAKAPTVSLLSLSLPSPAVQITVSAMAANANTVTVWRADSSGKNEVRGAVNQIVAGSYTIDDFEAPINEVLKYTAATYDVGGAISTESAGVTITLSSTFTWITDPIVPTNATPARIGSIGDRVYPITAEVMEIVGTDAPVAISGIRQKGAETITFVVITFEDLQVLRAVLKSSPVVLMRAPSTTWDIEAGSFVMIGAASEHRIGPIMEPTRVLSCEITFVARPDPGLAGPLHTWAELLGKGYTWRNLSDANTTWLTLAQKGGL